MRSILTLMMIAIPLLAAPFLGAAAASNVVRLTTATPEYCDSLSDRLAGLPGAVENGPRAMAEEGRRLCAAGHVRTGITWLRRALRAASGAD